ncbi:hypothetical protein GA0004736_3375 [Curtobacterium sp. 9128]|uniref:hypothetical protein n=1 Tax=Curtobacterium sp. 9128 TaxID=1793722 RepID=UPI0007D736F2|nr:hypothetical protein [Curtobacterium sp. 9128]SBN64415.1 hypothetical protein GA0004736_3375 [Curtobacterium sp. 9128]
MMMHAPNLERFAYSIPNFATTVDVSEDTVRKAINDGALKARYPTEAGRKPIIFREDAIEWLQNLPTEKPGAAA